LSSPEKDRKPLFGFIAEFPIENLILHLSPPWIPCNVISYIEEKGPG